MEEQQQNKSKDVHKVNDPELLNGFGYAVNVNVDNLTCGAFETLLGRFVDKPCELPQYTKEGMEMHLIECSECHKLYKAYNAVISTAKTLDKEAIPEAVRIRLRNRLEERLGIKFGG